MTEVSAALSGSMAELGDNDAVYNRHVRNRCCRHFKNRSERFFIYLYIFMLWLPEVYCEKSTQVILSNPPFRN